MGVAFPVDRLLFDLDGTLSDPLEGIGRSINHALQAHGLAPRALPELAPFIGPPLDDSFRVLTGRDEPAFIHALVASYRERYGDIGYAENQLYAGIPEVLQELRQRGLPLGLCTSKRADFADKILRLFGLRDLFDFISGGDIGIAKWQQIEALREQGRVSEYSLMVGDRAVDLSAAHRNGLRSVGVLWGYGSRAELLAERPHQLLERPQQLLEL